MRELFALSVDYDPSYHQNYYKQLELVLENGKYPTKKLKAILDVNLVLEDTGKYDYINYIDLSCINKITATIENIKKIDNNFPSRARQKVSCGDLLVSSLGGSIKSIAIVNVGSKNLIASTGFFVIKNVEGLDKNFLMYILRTSIFQTLLERETSGAIMPSISRDNFLNLKIPLPPSAIQERIAEEIQKRKQKTLKLTEEAKGLLEQAKKQVESMILGE